MLTAVKIFTKIMFNKNGKKKKSLFNLEDLYITEKKNNDQAPASFELATFCV